MGRTASSAAYTTPVAIVGAGPVGLALALGLARQGVPSIVVECRDRTSERSKAPAIQVRTREVFRQWGVAEPFDDAGALQRVLKLHSPLPGGDPLLSADFSLLEPEADRPGLLILEQAHTERLLLEAVRASGLCEVCFSTEAIGLTQDRQAVRLTLRSGGEEHILGADFVVGCDGAGSFVRDALGLRFDGITYSVRPMLADVHVSDARDSLPWPRTRNSRSGITTAVRLAPALWRIIRLERGEPGSGEEVGEAEVGDRVEEVLGAGPFELVWASRFRIHRRSAPRFRVGRVLLAGDAAHVHSPVGGLGMNGGIQDAHNLAWKLAHALHGGEVDRLLDSYDVERRAVMIESVSRYTDRVTRAFLASPRAVRSVAFALLRVALRSRRIQRLSLRRSAMLDLDYPASPLLQAGDHAAGVRLPNPVLHAPDGSRPRLYDLMPNSAVLLRIGEAAEPPPGLAVQEAIRIGPGAYGEPKRLLHLLLGGDSGWILVRPDTHVAWARNDSEGMAGAVRYALGLPAAR